MQKIEVGRSSYFINDRKQGDLPLNTLILIALKWNAFCFMYVFFLQKMVNLGLSPLEVFNPNIDILNVMSQLSL